MSDSAAALDALAAYCNIERDFRDAHGNMKAASIETQHALLSALGIEAKNSGEASHALQRLLDAEWRRCIPPVRVLSQTARPFQIDVRAPGGVGTIEWRIKLETGGERTGRTGFSALTSAEQRDVDGVRYERRILPLPDDLPTGYHELTVQPGAKTASLIVSPGKCWLPSGIEQGRRLWGLTVQMYLLRSASNWGIGDYSDLRQLAVMFAAQDAAIIGLNPLHGMFIDAPERASPYSPASRLQLNVLYIDVQSLVEKLHGTEAVRALTDANRFQAALKRCRSAEDVDYSGVAALKIPALRSLFAAARSPANAEHWRAFEDFRRGADALLERGSLFQALREHFSSEDSARADWRKWPVAMQDPNSPEVAHFAEHHCEAVTFYSWLQYVADLQLGAAAAGASCMAVGLYRDLAVGADPSGAETWANQSAVVGHAQVGAPPDIHNPQGQNWGLPPFNPQGLRAENYRSFIDLLRFNMRHAGGLRIDHVMALQHLYWIPQGKSAAEGAYVRYPLDDLVAIIALESQRNQCLVVGEDLGTVPDGFRERMAAANILSYRVLMFERDSEKYIAPDEYPGLALAVAGNHDLPTLRAWWEVSDLDIKDRLRLFPTSKDAAFARASRDEDIALLKDALENERLIENKADHPTLVQAVHRYLARTRSAFALVQLDDITDEVLPVNVPTTSDEYPNWRRRLGLTLDEIERAPLFETLIKIFRDERPADSSAETEGPRSIH